MTSYRLEIGARARSSGRFVGRVRSELLKALIEEKLSTGLTQHELARRLDKERAILNRELSGETNLTLSSVAELAWALNRELHIELRRPETQGTQNEAAMFSTAASRQARVFGRANASGATVQSSTREDV